MSDETEEQCKSRMAVLVEQADKETLWWALFRILSALHAARYEDENCKEAPEYRGGLYSVVHYTADYWSPHIPGMPSRQSVARECATDNAYHELTFWAERQGLRITGDEFI